MRRTAAGFLLMMFAFFCADTFGADTWQFSAGGAEKTLTPDAKGVYAVKFDLPGEAVVSTSGDRRTFRPGRADFDAGELSADIRLKSGGPVTVRLFVKDKDGLWFGSAPQTLVPGGEFQTVRARLDRPGMDWLPGGHQAPWCADTAVRIFTSGLLFYGEAQGSAEIEFRPVRKAGKRVVPALRIADWRLPAQTGRFEQIESRFKLTREYFNPFDPAEIQVDFEVASPSGETTVTSAPPSTARALTFSEPSGLSTTISSRPSHVSYLTGMRVTSPSTEAETRSCLTRSYTAPDFRRTTIVASFGMPFSMIRRHGPT